MRNEATRNLINFKDVLVVNIRVQLESAWTWLSIWISDSFKNNRDRCTSINLGCNTACYADKLSSTIDFAISHLISIGRCSDVALDKGTLRKYRNWVLNFEASSNWNVIDSSVCYRILGRI